MAQTGALKLTAVVVVAAGVCWWAQGEAEPGSIPAAGPGPEGASLSVFAEEAELTHKLSAQRAFSAYLDRVIAEVAEGKLELKQAVEDIRIYSLDHFPDHLRRHELMHPDQTVETALAISLVRCLHLYEEHHGLPLTDPAELHLPQVP